MLAKPDVADTQISAVLQAAYGIDPTAVEFLPIGADLHTAVYRLYAGGDRPWFLKLRRGGASEASVTIPGLLHAQGSRHVIAPVSTRAGRLTARLDDFAVVLYPFIDGQDGYQRELSSEHWAALGRTLAMLHRLRLPPTLMQHIPREGFSDEFRQQVRSLLAAATRRDDSDAAVFLRTNSAAIGHIVERAEQLAQTLSADSPATVLCHGDVHPGNVLITPDDHLFLVDWDSLRFAPPEQDFALIEQQTFFVAYGPLHVKRTALDYYRYERTVQDVAAFGTQLLFTNDARPDREQALRSLTGVVNRARIRS